MEYGILAIVLAFDLMIVKWKFEHNRYADAIVDVTCLAVLSWFMGGSLGGEIVATIAAFIISIYLLIYPPKFTQAFS